MTHANIRHLTPAEVAKTVQDEKVALVDVRERAEHAAERIEGAVLHPLSQFNPAALPAGRVIFHCGSGKRSITAIERAQAAGLPHNEHMQGGIGAWKSAGLPTRRG